MTAFQNLPPEGRERFTFEGYSWQDFCGRILRKKGTFLTYHPKLLERAEDTTSVASGDTCGQDFGF